MKRSLFGILLLSLRVHQIQLALLPSRIMDTSSKSSIGTPFPLDDVLTCYLEADDPPPRRPFPRAEVCVVTSAFASFLVVVGVVLLVLHHTVETQEGRVSLLEHIRVSSPLLALVLLSLAALLLIASLLAYAAWRVMEVLEMATRYRQHRELCAYEEMRASFRSQHGRFDSGRSIKRP